MQKNKYAPGQKLKVTATVEELIKVCIPVEHAKMISGDNFIFMHSGEEGTYLLFSKNALNGYAIKQKHLTDKLD